MQNAISSRENCNRASVQVEYWDSSNKRNFLLALLSLAIGWLDFPRIAQTSRSRSYAVGSCAIERLEESLVCLTEIARAAEGRFVDSPGGVHQFFKRSLTVGQTLF